MLILTPPEVADAALADWRQVENTLVTAYVTGDFATGLDLVNRIGASAEKADHHPDLTLTYSRVDIRMYSHDVGGVTIRDLRLARTISEHAASLGCPPAHD